MCPVWRKSTDERGKSERMRIKSVRIRRHNKLNLFMRIEK